MNYVNCELYRTALNCTKPMKMNKIKMKCYEQFCGEVIRADCGWDGAECGGGGGGSLQ